MRKPLRICVFTAKEDPAAGDMCVTTIRHHHHDACIVHLTDVHTPMLKGADQCWRGEWDGDLATIFMLRVGLLTCLDERDTIILDSDTLVCGSLESAFNDREFQVGLTWREKDMRYNAGVMFSRSRRFWVALEARMAQKKKHFTMTEYALMDESATLFWNIAEFDCRIWNNYWMSRWKVDTNAKILHYKGPRKMWMDKHFRAGVWRGEPLQPYREAA